MTTSQPPGWYYAQGDPAGTQRYWDGAQWAGGPQAVAAGGTVASSAQQKGDGFSRIGAWVIDALILVVPLAIVGFVIGGNGNQTFASFSARQWLSSFVTTGLWMAYHYFTNMNDGQSFGRKAVRLRIVKMNGEPAESIDLIKRFGFGFIGLVPIVGGLILLLAGLVSVVMIFIDDEGRAVWDFVAGTKTIEASG